MWHLWQITLRQRQYTSIELYISLCIVNESADCRLMPRLLWGWEPAAHGYLFRGPRFYTGIWSYCPSKNRNEALECKLEKHIELLHSTCNLKCNLGSGKILFQLSLCHFVQYIVMKLNMVYRYSVLLTPYKVCGYQLVTEHFMFNLSFPFQMEFIAMEGSVLSLCSAKRCFKFAIMDTSRVSSNAYIPIFPIISYILNPLLFFPIFSPKLI